MASILLQTTETITDITIHSTNFDLPPLHWHPDLRSIRHAPPLHFLLAHQERVGIPRKQEDVREVNLLQNRDHVLDFLLLLGF